MRDIKVIKEEVIDLEKKIFLCKSYKSKFEDYLQQAKHAWSLREITYEEYNNLLKQKIENKTIGEWIDYYERLISQCEEQIKSKQTILIRNKVLVSLYYILAIGGIFALLLSIPQFSDNIQISLGPLPTITTPYDAHDVNITLQNDFSHLNSTNLSSFYNITDAYEGRAIVSYWSFDIDTVNTITDYGYYNHDGAISSNPLRVSGLYGDAYQFDGIDDYFEEDQRIVDDYPFTLSAWIKVDSEHFGEIINTVDKDVQNRMYGIRVTTINGTASLYTRTDGGLVPAYGTTNVSDGNWHHIAGVFINSTDQRLYINSINEANMTSNYTFSPFVDRWSIGRLGDSSPGGYFNGTIDDVIFYGLALNETQVLQLFNNESIRFSALGMQSFRPNNVSDNENKLNITQTFTNNLTSSLSTRIGQINMSVSSNHGLLLYNPIEFNSAWDYSSNKNDVTTTIGTPTFNATSGVNGTGGVEFVPEEGYKIAWNDKLNATDELTISAWVKPTFTHVGPNDAVIVETNNLQNNDGYSLAFAEAQEDFQFRITTDVATRNVHTNAGWAADEWIHLVATYNGSNIYIYYNGVLNGTNDQSGKIITNTASNLSIGIRSINDNLGWDGTLDEISVWNRSLTAAEINALYNDTAKANNKIFYSDYQNLTSGEAGTFTILGDFVFPDLLYSSGENSFYTPNLFGNVILESFSDSTFTDQGTTIYKVEDIGNVDLNIGPTSTNITIKFEVYSPNGFSDLIDSTANVNFTRPGEPTRGTTCNRIVSESVSTYTNYTCDVTMFWFDDDGTWNITASIQNNSGLNFNDSSTFQINTLLGATADPEGLNFNVLSPGDTNRLPINGPLIINNTGNQDITSGNIQIKATHLIGQIDSNKAIYGGNFSVGPNSGSECNADQMGSNETTYIGITSASVARGNFTINDGTAQEELYVCLNLAGSELTAQSYSTNGVEGNWDIVFLLALLVRKRKLKEDKLFKALLILKEDLKESYSEEKEKAIKLLSSEIKKKYHTSQKEIESSFETEKIEIPISIFKKELGALESLVKYMKENLSMSYKEISKKLNRSEKTIWSSYNKANKKHPSNLKLKEKKTKIPIEIFEDKKFTILESTILYLKNKKMKFSEIGKLLDRNQKNVRTIYSNAVIKKSAKHLKTKKSYIQ